MAYDAGFVDVYLNGVRLDETDYTASSGTSIVLASAAALNDELNIVAFGTFSVANINGVDIVDGTITPNKLDRAYVNKAGDTMTGNLIINNGRLSIGQTAGDVVILGKDTGGNAFIDANIAGADFAIYTQLSGGGGSQRRIRVDSAGRVTMEYQPCFSVRKDNGTITTAPGIIVFNVIETNVGSHYNSGTGAFTAPIAGRYLFMFTGSSTATADFILQRNGLNTGFQGYSYSAVSTVEVCSSSLAILTLAANDVVRMNSVSPYRGDSHSMWSGALLG
jgi:hypothetical protein